MSFGKYVLVPYEKYKTELGKEKSSEGCKIVPSAGFVNNHTLGSIAQEPTHVSTRATGQDIVGCQLEGVQQYEKDTIHMQGKASENVERKANLVTVKSDKKKSGKNK